MSSFSMPGIQCFSGLPQLTLKLNLRSRYYFLPHFADALVERLRLELIKGSWIYIKTKAFNL